MTKTKPALSHVLSLFLFLHLSFGQYFPTIAPRDLPLLITTPQFSEEADDALSFESWAMDAGSKLNFRYGGGTKGSRKFSGSNPSLHTRHVTSLGLTNAFSDAIYAASVTIGTPPQKFNMIMDTGSADMWVAHSSCDAGRGCPGSASKFNHLTSTSFLNTSGAFNILYGSGQVKGTLAKESVSIGGLTVLGQTFGLCDSVDNILRPSLDVSGIMGLGWSGIASNPSTPAWESLFLQDALNEPVISFALRRSSDFQTRGIEPGGVMTFGGTNKHHYTGEIHYEPLSKNQSYWLIPLQSITVDETVLDIGTPDAAIDTGTSLIGGPAEDLKKIFSVIAGSELITKGSFSGYWSVPCQAPLDISVQFGQISYPIDSKDATRGKLKEEDRCLTSFFTINKPHSGPSVPAWIFGAAFLKNVYSVFRASPPSIGFAQLSAEFMGRTALVSENTFQSSLKQGPKTPRHQTSTGSASRIINLMIIPLNFLIPIHMVMAVF